MERLTEYHCGVAVIKDKNKLKDAMKKLANYEDLEEQGLISKPSCRVGDAYYWIGEDEDNEDELCIYKEKIKHIALKEDGWYASADDYNLYKIGTEDCFLTRTEAEKALAEMEKNNG